MLFLNKLKNKKYANSHQKEKELWDVEGILHNQIYKFDLRPMTKQGEDLVKTGQTNTKADKMVFDIEDKWVIVDIEELHTHLKENKLQKVYLQDLLSKLEWNIILPKT